MKFTKRMLSVFIAIMMLVCVVAVMTACGDDTEDSTKQSTADTASNPADTSSSKDSEKGDSNGAASKPSDSKPSDSKPSDSKPAESEPVESKPAESKPTESSKPVESTPDSQPQKPSEEKVSYTFEILTKKVNRPLSEVSVYVYNAAGYIAAMGQTDENGIVVLKVKPSDADHVEIDGLPEGYIYDSSYSITSNTTKIEVETRIIPNEDNSFSGVNYQLGDVIHDFTLTTPDGKTVSLSQLFADGKKAVVLNFWYTTCTYCIEEFPYLQAAYEKYKDQIEVIGINAYSADNENDILTFVNSFAVPGAYTPEGCELTFPMAKDGIGLQNAFGFTVNPCTVVIDRYGVISMVQIGGVLGERYFTNAFKHYAVENDADYEQNLYSSIYDLSPLMKPDITMDSSEDIKNAVVSGDMDVVFRPETEGEDAEYSWPFVIGEKDGVTCLMTTNVDLDNSWAIMYMDVTLEAGQAVMFDYYASTQRLYDVMYVLVDGKDIYSISGMPLQEDDGTLLEDPWKTCCTWVAEESGTYEIGFCYIKDTSDMAGDDRVYLKNFRVVDKEEIDVETYIPRYAATDLQTTGAYANYVDVVYNEEDGYYHVGKKDGPLLLAGLQGVNTQFYLKKDESERTTVTIKLTEDGTFKVNGEEKYTPMILYCQYATNSKLYGYCPVTEELKGFLQEYVKQNDFIVSENTWLELCSYYDAYGTEGQLEDPIKGLSQFSAYDAQETLEGEEGFKNVVTYHQIIMPRGYLYKFVPTKSGVYRITSKSSQEVDGWVFTGTREQWNNENGGDRILYIDSSTGERYCPELLVDTNGDDILERDYRNCSMIGYFEEGVEYYIDIAFYDVYAAGTFTFDLKFVGDTFDVFVEASPGVFTYEESVGDIIAGGINVKLCEDESDPRFGYYCHLLPNGELGSIVYADFYYPTNIFGTQSIEVLIEEGAFNMKMTATDREAYAYFKNYYEKDGIAALEELWGDNFEANWELYQMDDIIEGIYHGRGPDYTEAMRKYLAKMDDGKGGTDSIIYPERQGCVPVDAELATMLQALVDKFTFAGVDHSWTKLCYYYNSLGPIPTYEERLEELNTMVESAEITNVDIQSEIDEWLAVLDEILTTTSNKYVKLAYVEQVMENIYFLIEADKTGN